MNREEQIVAFMQKYDLGGSAYEIENLYGDEELHPAKYNNCFRVRLGPRTLAKTSFSVYINKSHKSIELTEALWHIADMAEAYSGLDTYKRWKEENENFIQLLGDFVAREYYMLCRNTYEKLLHMLGEERYQELNSIVTGD
jgi:hypothetical protein